MDPEDGVPQPVRNADGTPTATAPTMTGGPDDTPMPGTPAAEDPPAPADTSTPTAVSTVKVDIGGQEFEVSPDVAATLRAQETMIHSMNTSHQPAQPQTPKPEVNYESLMYEDPNTFVNTIKDELRAEIRQEYVQDQSRRDFFTGFYEKHKDLRGSEDLVNAALNANYDAWADKPGTEVYDLLANNVRTRIMSYVSQYSGDQPGQQSTPRTTVESGQQQQSVQSPAAPAAEPPKSAGQILRFRRQQRMG